METLAVKYRPKTFEDVVEQNVIKAILQNQINTGDIKNCYLFCGPAGCGKTTNGRLFARYINNNTGVITELDAASHNGVDDIRKITEDSKFKPVGQNYRVYLIDECFSAKTPIRTPSGNVPIKDIHVGDTVFNLCGETTVRHVFKNRVSVDRLACITISGRRIITTVDHLFFTEFGWKKVKDLKKGDVLFDYKNMCNLWEEFSVLSERWQKDMFKELYCRVSKTTNNKNIQNEKQKINKNMSNMSQTISNISICEFSDLWERLCEVICAAAWIKPETKKLIQEVLRDIHLSSLWEEFRGTNIEKSKILFYRMCDTTSTIESAEQRKEIDNHGVCLCYMWQSILRQLCWKKTDMFRRLQKRTSKETSRSNYNRKTQTEDDITQSIEKSRNSTEDVRHKGEEWYTSCLEWGSWWKWTFNRTAVETILGANTPSGRLGNGISCEDRDETGQWLPNELQVRPCLTTDEDWCGSGWQKPLVEKFAVERYKESGAFGKTWVDSVEVYKRGYNEELFSDCIDDTECNSEFVTLYDLEVEDHNSYFAEDVLVHNCHCLSAAAWAAALKTFEEPTLTSVFILCTTDPQKIPSTILSRIQRYDFQKITHSGVVNRLKYIIDCENNEGCSYTYEEDCLDYIAKLSEGGMRDAITLLEKALAFNNNLTMKSITSALGTVDYSTMFDLTDALCKMDKKEVIEIVETVHRDGLDLKQFIKNYNYFVLDLCKYDICKSFDYLQMPSTYSTRIKTYTSEDFAFFTQLLNEVINLNATIKWESTPKPIIESTFILLCAEA